jgi:hypothetical protein
MLTRFWITFSENPGYQGLQEVFGIGVGITAFSIEDAKTILVEKMFTRGVPQIRHVRENVSFDELDEGHVQPNMGVIVNRGIWFPKGFS